jgi:hypothetical protein
MVAAIGAGDVFTRGRDFAAWLGLVPKQISTGDPYDTWRRPSERDSFWPSWLAKDIPGLAVWTLAYESPTSNWLGTAMPLQDRAKNVLERLIGERELHGRQLVFVCHSLGGLLIKQVLRAADGRRAYGDEEGRLFVESVRGIVFIATPHSGSVHATVLDKLRIIAWPCGPCEATGHLVAWPGYEAIRRAGTVVLAALTSPFLLLRAVSSPYNLVYAVTSFYWEFEPVWNVASHQDRSLEQ